MQPETPHPDPVRPSPRKLAALSRLRPLALKVSDGSEYQLSEALIPGVTLGEIREMLKSISGPLAETVVEERECS